MTSDRSTPTMAPAILTDSARDARFAVRSLRRAPGFTAASILILALGIGACTAIFAVVDAVLLRPLPFPEPDRLAMLRPSSGSRVSAGYLHEWRLQTRAFQDLAGWRDVRVHLTGRGAPREVLIDRATANFFALLGTAPIAGRTFTAADDLALVQPEAVLSHGFWQREYGGRSDAIGESIVLDGEAFAIVGVMPPGFTVRTTELSESRAELWTPLALVPQSRIGMGGVLNVVARLRSGVTIAQAQSDTAGIAQAIEREHPSYSRAWSVAVLPLLDATVKDVRPAVIVAFASVTLLLLACCANVATLGLNRAVGRHAEMAIRRSLGATNPRLFRQVLVESVVLAVFAGAMGVLAARGGVQVLVAALPATLDVPRVRDIAVDWRVLAFSLSATLTSALMVGVAPFLGFRQLDVRSALHRSSRGSTADSSGTRLRSGLIVAEVAIALVLLAGAGLLTRSFWALSAVDPGFHSSDVVTLRTTLSTTRYASDDRVRAFGAQLLERVQQVPGIQAAGTVNYLPLSQIAAAQRFQIEGRPEPRVEDQKAAALSIVGGRYLDAMGIPLLRGRLPGDADSERTQPVFVIDEHLARRYWPNEDPIGARLIWNRGQPKPQPFAGEIVGVVGSVRWRRLAADPPGMAYWWFPQAPDREVSVVVRSHLPASAIAGVIADHARAIDPDQPLADLRALTELAATDLRTPRFMMFVLGAFAVAALMMATIGLYAVIALSVAQRTREVGVRLALGAERRDVVRLVMRRGLVLVAVGLALGIAAAVALGRFVAALLFGVTATDPLTLVAAAIVLSGIAALAAYLPARRVARVDPAIALRAQ